MLNAFRLFLIFENRQSNMVVEPYITNTLFESDDSLALESDYDTDFAFAIACEKLLVQCEESKRLSRTFVGTLGKATRQALFHATVSIQSDAVVAVIIDRIVFIWFIPLLLSSLKSQLSNKPKQDY